MPLTTYGYSQPALGNLTDDAAPELVASDIEGGVVAVDDIDGDGTAEVLVASAENTTLLSANGTVEWVAAYSGESLATAPGPNGTTRAIVAETGSVTALDGATGRQRWRHEIEGTPAVHAVGDGRLYAGISRGKILALDVETGDTVWSYRSTVVPIAAAYEVAHNYPFVLRNLGRLPGTVGLATVDPLAALSLGLFWASQTVLIVLGHVVTVVAAHRVATTLTQPADRRCSLTPRWSF